MAAEEPISFNIDEGADGYERFIQKLRKALSRSTSHDIPVLMPQSGPLRWIDVRLIAGHHIITLRMDRRNLYVRGYMRNGDTRFWEFSDTTDITNSRRLGYSSSYVKVDGVGRKAGVQRDNLPVGSYPLHDAIRDLAGIENPNSDQERSARPLLVIIQMIAEAARLKSIVAHIVEHWWNAERMTLQMVRSQNAWGTFSTAVHNADTIPTGNVPFGHTPLAGLPDQNWIGVWTVGHAVRAFGILLCHEIRQRARTLVSIEYVRVKNIDRGSPRQLYGTVTVEDCWGSHTVYQRSPSNAESKGPGDYATLTGPSAAISGEDAFTISVSLSDRGRNDEIAKGEIVWDPRSDSSYDTPLSADVSGKHGSVTVGYSVIREALSATVSVKIIGRGANVYGTIKASSQFQSSMTLFDKSRNEKLLQVLPQAPIPLSRAVIPAPVHSIPAIELDLWDHGSSSGNQIAKGSVQFPPKIGTQDKNISAGKYGQVNVSIACGFPVY